MKTVRPAIAVVIPPSSFLSHWTQMELVEKLPALLLERFPNETFKFPICQDDGEGTIEIFPLRFADVSGELLEDYLKIAPSVLEEVGNMVLELFTEIEAQNFEQFRSRLEKCESGLREYKKRPPILSEFMYEITQLYGFVIETDFAYLMAGDHFRRIAEENPTSSQSFFRQASIESGMPMPSVQYSRTSSQLAQNFRVGNRNHTLKNRTTVFFLFDMWERRYRVAIAKACGRQKEDIRSPFFGDLRKYRNAISHNDGILDQPTETLKFVKRGRPIDLTQHMDEIFRFAVAELNRLASEYFEIDLRFSLDSAFRGIPVHRGPSWRN